MRSITLAVTAVLFLSACSINQNIEPASIVASDELCIVENKAIKEGFLKEYIIVLNEKGIANRLVNEDSMPAECQWISRYTANWGWDLRAYMVYAEIKIFHGTALDGEAIYDARKGSGNMNKFINAQEKVRELVEELLKSETALFLKSRSRA